MLKIQLEIIQLWHTAGDAIRTTASARQDDRGEVTGQTALIVLLVTAAIAAGVAIAAAMTANTSNIPTP